MVRAIGEEAVSLARQSMSVEEVSQHGGWDKGVGGAGHLSGTVGSVPDQTGVVTETGGGVRGDGGELARIGEGKLIEEGEKSADQIDIDERELSRAREIELLFLKKLPRPIFRWDVWPFLLLLFPLLWWFTVQTWDRWHVPPNQVLSNIFHDSFFCDPSYLPKALSHEPQGHKSKAIGYESLAYRGEASGEGSTPFLTSIFDFVNEPYGALPAGIPSPLAPTYRSFTDEGVKDLFFSHEETKDPFFTSEAYLLEPRLFSNNFYLLLCAAWVLSFATLVLAFLMPSWSVKYKARCLYRRAPSLKQATVCLVHDRKTKRTAFCPIEPSLRFASSVSSQREPSLRFASSVSSQRSQLTECKQIDFFRRKFHLLSASELAGASAKLSGAPAKPAGAVRKGERMSIVQETKSGKKRGYLLMNEKWLEPVCLQALEYEMGKEVTIFGEKLAKMQGIENQKRLSDFSKVFGKNEQDIPIPTFAELFKQHAVQPLFVFQIFSMVLWLLDEYWQYSLMTLGLLLVFETQMVLKRRKDLSTIKSLQVPPIAVAVRRGGRWYRVSSLDLLPGDLFTLALDRPSLADLPCFPAQGQGAAPVPAARLNADGSANLPCDALLLRGNAVVNEAMLTGESIPQMKSALDTSGGEKLDFNGIHKSSALFAGTQMMLESKSDDDTSTDDAPGDAIASPVEAAAEGATASSAAEWQPLTVLYALRTGFATTQGKLVRTALFASDEKSTSAREPILFLFILLFVALIASSYVLLSSWGVVGRDHFKLLLHCVMIITSVVPAELPMTLSLTVTTSLTKLFKKKLFCTEPLRLPLAGRLNVCCFDKTGTLTSTDVILEHTLFANKSSASSSSESLKSEIGKEAALVMGLCHSVVCTQKKSRLTAAMRLETQNAEETTRLVGDPCEIQAIKSSAWHALFQKPNFLFHMRTAATPSVECADETATIRRRFPFQSAQQRMTVIAEVTPSPHTATHTHTHNNKLSKKESEFWVLCKGAPSRLEQLVTRESLPANYGAVVRDLSARGKRLFALAARQLSSEEVGTGGVGKMGREKLEKNLIFCGLLVFTCPVKYKTVETLRELKNAGHHLMMITGDDPRTAAQVAIDTGLTSADTQVLMLQRESFLPSTASTQSFLSPQTTTDSPQPHTHTHTHPVSAESSLKGTSIKLFRRDDSLAPIQVFLPRQGKGILPDALSKGEATICMTGEALRLLSPSQQILLLPCTQILSRVSPKEKELVLTILKNDLHATTLMCGDGTNDVGALRAAHVGVSLLNFDLDKIKSNTKKQTGGSSVILKETAEASRKRRLSLGLNAAQIARLEKVENAARSQQQAIAALPASWGAALLKQTTKTIATLEEKFAQDNIGAAHTGSGAASNAPPQGGLFGALLAAAGANASANTSNPAPGTAPAHGPGAGADLMGLMDEEMALKPGDASMAAPFTYRGQSVKCVKILVKSGKATLATVMMSYKLMALNSLTSAFSLSVLTLNGVKFDDFQATAESLFISVLFMATSHAKASNKLDDTRTPESLFHPTFYLSVLLQALIHIATCSMGWALARAYEPKVPGLLDGPFKPSLVNTVIFLLHASQHVTTFTANYEGEPFLIAMNANKVLGLGCKVFIALLLAISAEIFPFVNAKLKLVSFPSNRFRYLILALILLDLAGATLVGQYFIRKGRAIATLAAKNHPAQITHMTNTGQRQITNPAQITHKKATK